jgi:hypothetical protein
MRRGHITPNTNAGTNFLLVGAQSFAGVRREERERERGMREGMRALYAALYALVFTRDTSQKKE